MTDISHLKFKQTQPLLPNGCSILVFDSDIKIGYAHISVVNNTAILADIKVTIIKQKHTTGLTCLTKTLNYRNQGIGTKLLKSVIALCRTSEIDCIIGEIIENIEQLSVWYKKHGFNVQGSNIKLDFNK